MKKSAWTALGILLLATGGCVFDRDAPVAYVPEPREEVESKTDELPSEPSPEETAEPETIPTDPETIPTDPETAPTEPDPSEIIPPETPMPVPPQRAATVGVFQGEVPLRPLLSSSPTLGESCGAAASITGGNAAGRVTLGAGASNFCKITFGASHPFDGAPVCTASPASAECGGWVTVGTTMENGFFLLAGDGTVNFEADCAVNYICVVSE